MGRALSSVCEARDLVGSGRSAHTGGTGWHLPSQKELTQLYINGISRMGNSTQSAFGSTNALFWSSSLYSISAPYAWFVNLASGRASTNSRGTSALLCLRPGVALGLAARRRLSFAMAR
jgi:hypothetical protein